MSAMAVLGWAGAAQAFPAPVSGQPVDGAIDLQAPATIVARNIHDFHNFLLVIITATTLVVVALLATTIPAWRASRIDPIVALGR